MTPSVSSFHCLICRGRDFEDVIRYDAPDSYEQAVGVPGSGYARAWVRCRQCGFHFSLYSRDPAILDRLYEGGYRESSAVWRRESTEATFHRVIALPAGQSETKTRVAWIKAEMDRARAAELLPRTPPPWRMVDVGGATGIMAYEFQDADWRTMVVDPAPEGRFVEAHGVAYLQSAYRPGLVSGPVDLFTLVYALEHLSDPRGILAALRRDLNPGGGLYVEVPDAAAFGRKPADDDIFNACHLWMFDPRSLVTLLAESGFETLKLERTKTIRGHYATMILAAAS
ncbi:MAG: class I SAM-dependent methyltransferase [Alphaproteobacteria bacterium]